MTGEAILSVIHPTDFSDKSYIAFIHALKISLALRADFTILGIPESGFRLSEKQNFPTIRSVLVKWGMLKTG